MTRGSVPAATPASDGQPAGMPVGALAGACPLAWSDQPLWLLPQRALWWPAEHTLFVADVHLGKAASFRALGQPVPSGTTRDNLQRLGELVQSLSATRLVVLGDLLHAAAAQQPGVLDPLRYWRGQHAALDCLLVRGNHDSHAGDPPPDLRFGIVDEPHPLGPFAACHHPRQVPDRLALAGHVHPAITLHGRARERQRLPCFALLPGCLVLPAFGAFTGTTTRGLPEGARCYPVGGGRVWAAP